MLIKDAKFGIDARKKQLIQQQANALKDAKLRGELRPVLFDQFVVYT